ncbi:MAG: restriction endonuclease [Lachnospiraceae bacterium]|nr:restriction endonuclease [Lachnospiraceae bacterium]
MDFEIEYDKSNPLSIEAYAQKLIGKTFRQIWDEDDARQNVVHEDLKYGTAEVIETKRNKGNLGQIVEEKFFHYECNSDSRADFHEAGVELKVTPYKINKNGSISAKERLILTMIDYFAVVNEDFESSHLWNKSKLILLVYYLYQKEIQFNLDYKIGYSSLFTPPMQDVMIIRHDYEVIVEKIRAGRAHELSEGDTLYLGAAPKAATSKDRRKQPFSEELAKPRAFAFKNSYMTYVLNNYIVPGKDTYEAIMQDGIECNFEDYVISKINSYKDYTVEALCSEFQIECDKKPKNLEAMLAYRILGIKGNHAEEFEKANIVVKTIRIGKNNKIKESMSFPTFKFKELIEEEWETSVFGTYLSETRFFFVVYKFDENDVLRLKGCQFWNIPYADLENEVKKVWNKTKQVIIDGLQIEQRNGKNYNNFPNASENPVCHVRPHAKNAQDTYELPDGRQYPKQCFWLNNHYILSQLKGDFKEG